MGFRECGDHFNWHRQKRRAHQFASAARRNRHRAVRRYKSEKARLLGLAFSLNSRNFHLSTSNRMNPNPQNASENAAPPSQPEIEAAEEFVAGTPATLPLKRGTEPLFVPAVLPEESEAAPPEIAPKAEVPEPPITEVAAKTEIAPEVAPEVAPEATPEVTPESAPEKPAESSLPSVEFFPPPGASFSASLTLELRCADPNAQICYALDAEDVGENGTLYTPGEKILLTGSANVAARAFVGENGGPLARARFEIAQPAWQKIEPIDPADPAPHEISDETALEGPWRLAAASVRGKLHAHRGFWREDSYLHGVAHASDGTYSIVIVSDGAGSANLSRVGSKLLCEVSLEHLRTALTQFAPLATDQKELIERDLPPLRALLVEAASLALQKLREEADRRARPLSDFSSTLLILVRCEWNGAQLCAALQSGDGSIALWDDDGTLTLLGEADHGEHSSETKFLTTRGMEAELPSRVKFSIRQKLHATAVMSDGVADDFFPESVRFPELFGQILPIVKNDTSGNAAALLDWIDYEKKGSSDDRALVVCWRSEAEKVIENGSGDGVL
jgi:serine/threonine protein phosphatase PrpC